jgi:hypothetical protein
MDVQEVEKHLRDAARSVSAARRAAGGRVRLGSDNRPLRRFVDEMADIERGVDRLVRGLPRFVVERPTQTDPGPSPRQRRAEERRKRLEARLAKEAESAAKVTLEGGDSDE